MTGSRIIRVEEETFVHETVAVDGPWAYSLTTPMGLVRPGFAPVSFSTTRPRANTSCSFHAFYNTNLQYRPTTVSQRTKTAVKHLIISLDKTPTNHK